MNAPDPSTDSTGSPLTNLLGIKPIHRGQGTSEVALTVDDRLLRNCPILHGGVTAALLDTALGMAADTMAPPQRLTVTTQLNINFVRPAVSGDRLLATASVSHVGRQSIVAAGEVHAENDRLIATATATFLFAGNDNRATTAQETS
ncbi:MAG: thioesterase [Planctomycetaceae bacterium]|jgi:uncharacterized protein (TIGR00369 family)|nr:thioesterase [Planctomycetaceae bacterium]MDP7276148.1 PaaI family thioesterase [Planctomycetaceae bacterium]